jgi:hypothetical protein
VAPHIERIICRGSRAIMPQRRTDHVDIIGSRLGMASSRASS